MTSISSQYSYYTPFNKNSNWWVTTWFESKTAMLRVVVNMANKTKRFKLNGEKSY